MILQPNQVDEISKLLLSGKIGVLPTDTIYGVHCKALDPNLANRVYEIKDRPTEMPLITVISSEKDLKLFGISPTNFQKDQIKKYWPGPNTLIFRTNNGETKSFRLPNNDFLISILKNTGPLVSTSANLHGQPSAKNISDAQNYFGDKIDFYVDGGNLNNPPSNVYDISNDSVIKLR